MKLLTTVAVTALAFAAPAFADWTLDNAKSSLSFVSVKAGNIGEVHRFTRLQGSVSATGEIELVINLASVDTLIPIRDERMREILFDVIDFPTATLKARVDLGAMKHLAAGDTLAATVGGDLTVKGRTSGIAGQVIVAKLSATQVLVAASQPVIVAADSLGLGEGIEKLREIAGLPSISHAVPVSFVLVFNDE